MTQVYPFRAFRYNPARAPFDRVLTQPYDKISPAIQERYYAADPHNLIVVGEGTRYPGDTPQIMFTPARLRRSRTGFARTSWCRMLRPLFYAYTQEYTVPGTEERRTRQGFIRRGKTRGIFRGSRFPARAHASGAESGPAGTPAAHQDAHRAAFHAVFGCGEAHRRDSGGSARSCGAGHRECATNTA